METPAVKRAFVSRAYVWVTIVAGLAAALSLWVGVRRAMVSSVDLEWMGARLVGQHIDPWKEALADYPHGYEHFSPPNYLHHTYLLLWPLGHLPLHGAEVLWCGCTLILSVVCVILMGRIFTLERRQMLLLLLLFWAGSPFRTTLQVGQMSVVILLFYCLAYAAATQGAFALWWGLSFAKYSFTPVAAFLYLLRGRFRVTLLAAIVPVVGLLVTWWMVRTPMAILAFEPFKVAQYSRTAVNPGFVDLMTMTELVLRGRLAAAMAQHVAYLFGLVVAFGYAVFLSRYKRVEKGEEFVLISLATLAFIKHLSYDFVFLAPVAAYGLSTASKRIRWTALGGVAIFWFSGPLVGKATVGFTIHPARFTFNFVVFLAFVGLMTWEIVRKTGAAGNVTEGATSGVGAAS